MSVSVRETMWRKIRWHYGERFTGKLAVNKRPTTSPTKSNGIQHG